MRTILLAVALLVAGCSASPGPDTRAQPGCRVVGPCLFPDGGTFETDPAVVLDYVCDPGEFPVAEPGRNCLVDSTRGGGAMCCASE